MPRFASLVFIIFVLLIVFKYTKVFEVNVFILIGVFCLWIIMVYIQTHLKNKERNTPKPVYLTKHI